MQDGCRHEGSLEEVERLLTVFSPHPRCTFMCQPSERNSNVQVIEDKTTIEVGEAEKRLNVCNLPRFRPITDRFDFVFSHCETFGSEDVTEEFNCVFVPFTFTGFSVESVFSEAS